MGVLSFFINVGRWGMGESWGVRYGVGTGEGEPRLKVF